MFKQFKETKTAEGKERRHYREDITGTEIVTYNIYTDEGGNQYFAFEDLFTLPFQRHHAAKKVIDLYGSGLVVADVRSFAQQIKLHLKAKDDPERYEKAMAEVIKLEQLTDAMADPVKQTLGLITVYMLINKEQPDVYTQEEMNFKMALLANDIDAQAFFLGWWTEATKIFGTVLKGLSATVSQLQKQGTTTPVL